MNRFPLRGEAQFNLRLFLGGFPRQNRLIAVQKSRSRGSCLNNFYGTYFPACTLATLRMRNSQPDVANRQDELKNSSKR